MRYTKKDIEETFISLIAEERNLDPEKIKVDSEFHTHGLDSISAIHVLDKLENFFEIEINPLDFWDYPTIEKFSAYLLEHKLS